MLKEIEFQMSQNPSNSEADMNLARQLLSDINDDVSRFDHEKYIRLVLAWKTKSIKRHFISENGMEVEDNISQRWSTGFYRIDLSLKTFKEKLQGKKILDPYAGSGSLEFSLMALGIINDVTLSDISYLGGIPITDINHTGYFYNPLKNLAVYNEVLSNLVTGFKDIEKPKVLYANVLDELPFSNKSFDYVIGDPPYGANLNRGKGLETFVEAQQELLRVSKYGILAFIPQDWINEFQNNINIQVLSNELLHEKTTLKTSLVQISQ